MKCTNPIQDLRANLLKEGGGNDMVHVQPWIPYSKHLVMCLRLVVDTVQYMIQFWVFTWDAFSQIEVLMDDGFGPILLVGNSVKSGQAIWCESRDHVVTQPTIKIEIWSREAELSLIGVWHNGKVSQGTNIIGMSRMTPRNQLIFNKSNSVKTEKIQK
jgi:hypothetical protein